MFLTNFIVPRTLLQANENENGIFAWDADERGLVLGCYYYGYVFSNIPGGWLSQRLGFKRVMIYCMLAAGILTLITPYVVYLNFKAFIILRILIGFVQVKNR